MASGFIGATLVLTTWGRCTIGELHRLASQRAARQQQAAALLANTQAQVGAELEVAKQQLDAELAIDMLSPAQYAIELAKVTESAAQAIASVQQDCADATTGMLPRLLVFDGDQVVESEIAGSTMLTPEPVVPVSVSDVVRRLYCGADTPFVAADEAAIVLASQLNRTNLLALTEPAALQSVEGAKFGAEPSTQLYVIAPTISAAIFVAPSGDGPALAVAPS